MEEIAAVEQGASFGNVFPLDVLGLDLPPDAIIPGVAVASARATPLAGETVFSYSVTSSFTEGCLDGYGIL